MKKRERGFKWTPLSRLFVFAVGALILLVYWVNIVPNLTPPAEPSREANKRPLDTFTNDPIFIEISKRCKISCTKEQWEDTCSPLDPTPIPNSFPDINSQRNQLLPCEDDKNKFVNFYSHLGQDEFISNYFQKKCGGTFLDIGAHHGSYGSNTRYLEEKLNWKGICIDGNPHIYPSLVINRPTCTNQNLVIANTKGHVKFVSLSGYGHSGIWDLMTNYGRKRFAQVILDAKNDECVTYCLRTQRIQDVLDKVGVVHIDFFSLDVVGAELSVLETIDWSKTTVSLFSVGHNPNEPEKMKLVKDYLFKLGYEYLKSIGDDGFYEKKVK